LPREAQVGWRGSQRAEPNEQPEAAGQAGAPVGDGGADGMVVLSAQGGQLAGGQGGVLSNACGAARSDKTAARQFEVDYVARFDAVDRGAAAA